MTRENFQVNLRGIVEILSHHLYSSPRVYLRELIQNARDAVVARRALDPTAPIGIEIEVDQYGGEVIVRDEGIGLSEDEMRSLLATIGASSKRGEFLAARRQYLGQFGIGLLSCFLIADEIEVRSRSARGEDAPTVTWLGSADGTYTVRRAEQPLDRPGTEVRVRARVDDREWVGYQRVHLLAEQFASLIDLPVVLRAAGTPERSLVSTRTPPWAMDEESAAWWCRQQLGFTPLAVLPVEVQAAGVRGVAYIADSPGRVGNRRGDVVHSHGMFVAADNTQLTPHWAFFVQLAVEAGELGLTASRESLQDGELLGQVREQIGVQIRAQIERLAERDPLAFARFLEVHDKGLLAMAVHDREMLDFVVRHLRWETSEGPLTLHRIFRTRGGAQYVTGMAAFSAFAPLMRARGTVLVNGGYVYGAEILRLVEEDRTRYRGLEPFSVEGLLRELPHPSGADSDLAARIRAHAEPVLSRLGMGLELRSFEPDSIPVLAIGLSGGFEVEDAEEPDPWAGFAEEFVTTPRGPRIVFNLQSPPVRALAGDMDSRVRSEAITGLYVLGLLMAGESIDERHSELLSGTLRTLIEAATGG